ncbi:MAG: uridine monophosphate kinase [Clostridia bacterium]|nr:uridine monophosphate kinase [Clostridia bacterium]
MPGHYRRVILKLSGEALGTDGRPFCHDKFVRMAQVLAEVPRMGIQTAVVIGGGNVWRGRRGDSLHMGAVAADQMGMIATLQNCLYMRDTLTHLGCKSLVMSGVDIPRFAENYNTAAALERLEQGYILLLACGLGNPFFSTDSATVLRAVELECDAILMAKNIDGVYTADPAIHPGAVLLPDLRYEEAAERDLRVMDAAAFIMLRDNSVPLVRIFGMEPPDNVLKVLAGDPIGSFLHP